MTTRYKKYYRISDLINDYIKLQRENHRLQVNHLKSMIDILTILFPDWERDEEEHRGINMKKLILGYKEELERIK